MTSKKARWRQRWRITLLLVQLLACQRREEGEQPNRLPRTAASGAVSGAPMRHAAPTIVRPRVDNLVLITIDALRADQPWVGYSHIATPNLTQLAAQSVVYTRAYSLANFTTASLNAMLASRYPSELGRTSCSIGRYDIPGSLAPTLQAGQVATLAAHGHAIFAGETAPSLGFDRWLLVRGAAGKLQTKGAVVGNDIAELALAEWEAHRSRPQRFLWSHFVDPHDLYVAHSAYPATSQGTRARYDSEVAYTDMVVGRILRTLAETAADKSTAIVVTADHGEAFGEHGFTKHGFSLYDEEIRVPLVLRIPGVEPRKVDVPRSTIDIAPTIAELLGVEVPRDWKGRSLLDDWHGQQPPEQRPVIVDVPEMPGRPPMRTVIRGPLKVILDRSPRVFDLRTDPDERTPLTGSDASTAVERATMDASVIATIPGAPCVRAPRRISTSEGI